MKLRNFVPLVDEPSLEICSWRILQASYRDTQAQATMHFLGRCAQRPTSRVSSAIRSLELDNRRGRTESGRLYKLVGEPSINGKADCLWQAWAALNKVASWSDVTRHFLEAVEPGRNAPVAQVATPLSQHLCSAQHGANQQWPVFSPSCSRTYPARGHLAPARQYGRSDMPPLSFVACLQRVGGFGSPQ